MANLYNTKSDGYDTFVLLTPANIATRTEITGALVENVTSSTVFWQVHDGYASSGPTALQVPLLELQIAGNSQESLDLPQRNQLIVSKGLIVAASSTRGVYTAASNSVWQTVFYSLV